MGEQAINCSHHCVICNPFGYRWKDTALPGGGGVHQRSSSFHPFLLLRVTRLSSVPLYLTELTHSLVQN